MTFITPFRAVRYNTDKIRDLSLVTAPPYDIISPKMQKALYRVHPYNIVRLILGRIEKGDSRKDNRYTRARRFFDAWLAARVMTQDPSPALYIYSQAYKEGRRPITRTGFIGLMALNIGKRTRVLPHENTLAAPKRDRLNLMREVNANLSPIFVLYEDKRHEVVKWMRAFSAKKKPMIDIGVDGVRHRVWKVDDTRYIDRISAIMENRKIFIADGHHRFETARNYSAEIQNDKDIAEDVKRDSRHMMSWFVESDERILTILPSHRLIRDAAGLKDEEILARLSRFFTIEKPDALNALKLRLEELSGQHAFGMYMGRGRCYILKLNNLKDSDSAIGDKPRDWRRLDVSILHLFILRHVLKVPDDDDNVDFVKDPKEATGLVDKKRFRLAFFLNPTKVSEVKRIARLGERMPRKATYFYPKPLSGLVINKFGD